jgi:co-chaperonin GroES (HSP10)
MIKDKIHVKYREREQGVVILPDCVEEKERLADVISVGKDVRNVKPGDIVKVFEGVEGFECGDGNVITENLIMGIMDGDVPVPMSNRVLVRPDKHPDKVGSFFIPDTAKKKVLYGTVVAAGKGKYYGDKFVPNEVSVGDRVLYAQFSGGYDGFKINGIPHLSMRDEDILMVLEND